MNERDKLKALAAEIDALSNGQLTDLLNLLGESSLQTIEDFAEEYFDMFHWGDE